MNAGRRGKTARLRAALEEIVRLAYLSAHPTRKNARNAAALAKIREVASNALRDE